MQIQCTLGEQTQLLVHEHVTKKPSKTPSFAIEMKNFDSNRCMKTFPSAQEYIQHVLSKHYDPSNKKIDQLGDANPFLEKHIHFASNDCRKVYLKNASFK